MENSILDLADLADLLGRSPETIKKTSAATVWPFLLACISQERGS